MADKAETDYVKMLRQAEVENYKVLAALETIRVNQFVPFNMFTQKVDGGNNVTAQKVIFDSFEPGYIYVVVNVCAWNEDDAGGQIRIGITDGATDTIYESATYANQRDSVEYIGQLMCKETDKIFAEFRAAGAADKLYVSMNGYKIKR